MNAKKTMGMICALTASVLSVSVEAAPEQKGLQACIDAMATKLSIAQGAPLKANMSEANMPSNRQLGLSTTFSLDAFNPESKVLVARMDCTVNARGKVMRLMRVADNAPDAKTRSL